MVPVQVTRFEFDKVLICGVGLIGGSLARALRAAHRDGRVGGRGCIVGVDRDAAALQQAQALGIIDAGCVFDTQAEAPDASDDALVDVSADAFAAQVAGADLIVLAVPVAQARALIALAAPVLTGQAVLTDVGSTKQTICDAAWALLGQHRGRFVGGHPIAGGEKSGVVAACDDLFLGKNIVLCPVPSPLSELSTSQNGVLPDQADVAGNQPLPADQPVAETNETDATSPAALSRVEAMWQAVGGRTAIMSSLDHDRLFAAVSHMPHLLAFAFMEHILQSEDPTQRLAFAGSGFRDFTRIAASNPEMWRDICLANRESILLECDHFLAVLAGVRAAVAAGDAGTLETIFARARESRAAWQQNAPAAGKNAE